MKPTPSRPSADILVVDDTPANLQLLSDMLKQCGHRVRPVPDGRLALQAARRKPPELILLDINMPEMSGYEVCDQLKADPRLSEVPVIFISANTDILDIVKAFALGGVDYVTKPFQFDEVEARVETHLEIQRLRLELEGFNRSLQNRVREQVKEISASQIATIIALAKLAEFRDKDTGNHILRVQHYCRALAKKLADEEVFGDQIDEVFLESILVPTTLSDHMIQNCLSGTA